MDTSSCLCDDVVVALRQLQCLHLMFLGLLTFDQASAVLISRATHQWDDRSETKDSFENFQVKPVKEFSKAQLQPTPPSQGAHTKVQMVDDGSASQIDRHCFGVSW